MDHIHEMIMHPPGETLDQVTSLSVQMVQMREELAEAKARLADLALGAQMMLDMPRSPHGWPDSAVRYAREVKRVASTPL